MALNELLDDALGVSCEPQEAHTALVSVVEALALAGVGTSGCRYSVALADPLALFCRVLLNGEEWDCWSLATSQFFPSVYSNFDFNSFAHHNEQDYAANDNGVYVIDGDTDDGQPFHTGILFHYSSFGSTNRKKFRKVFVNAIGANISFQADTETGVRTFTIVRGEANITRDLRGRRWQFAVSDFDVFDYFEAFPTTLTR